MDVQFVWRPSINPLQWDVAVENAHNTRIYAYSWYLDIVCQKQWGALILGNYDAILPLPYNRKWLGIAQAYQPMFCQQLGIFSAQHLPIHTIHALYRAIPTHFRRVHLQGNSQYNNTGKPTTLQPNYILHTNTSYPQLYAQYNTNTKRNIKKAAQHQLVLTNQLTANDLIQLFGQARPHLQYPLPLQRIFVTLANEALQRNAAFIRCVRNPADNTLYAGALFLQDSTRCYYLLGASNQLGKTCGAAHYLLDSVVQQIANTDLILDFEGSKTPSFAQFYAGFGATLEYYPLTHYWQIPLLPS